MASYRKYLKFRIDQLEDTYKKAQNSASILRELEEELRHRKTKRAQNLLSRIESDLSMQTEVNISTTVPEAIAPPTMNNKPNPPIKKPLNSNIIDWEEALRREGVIDFPAAEPMGEVVTNHASDILEAWAAIEAFSPQTYKRPQDLQGGGSVAYLRDGEPWFRGEKSRPSCNLYYVVHLGSIELGNATEQLISAYQDKRAERPSAQGKVSLGAILVNKSGVPIPETGIAISSFGWAYGQVLRGNLSRIKHWEVAEKILIEKLESLV